MAVYQKDGTEVTEVYDVDGELLEQAYDIEGNELLDSTPHFVIMTYNVQRFGGINSQQAMQNAIVALYKPDLIGLQELGNSSMPTVGETMLVPYSYQDMGSQTNKTGLASKIELEDVTDGIFTHQAGEQRGYNKAYFTIRGKRICWLNTHLEYANASARYGQMSELFTIAESEDYVILTGDFNSYCLNTSDNDYINMFKQFVDAGYKLANNSAISGFTKTWTDATSASTTADLIQAFDSIIVSGNMDITSVVFDLTKFNYLNGSSIDHIPVVAHVQVN